MSLYVVTVKMEVTSDAGPGVTLDATLELVEDLFTEAGVKSARVVGGRIAAPEVKA